MSLVLPVSSATGSTGRMPKKSAASQARLSCSFGLSH